jgi:inosine triphosphate pyrophosphatase
MEQLTFITGNAAKAKYLKEYFHIPVDHLKLDLIEIQSLDLQEIAIDKAKRAYEIVQKPVLVEDVSLTFIGLKSLPGPLIKWFLETLGNEGLCKLVDSLSTRDAVAAVEFVLYDESGPHCFGNSVKGTVTEIPRGERTFGWSQIFIPDGFSQTWEEMSEEEREKTSLRKPALEGLSKYLNP